ncbi:hypothetical protein [Barrientosiimonas endolithica]|nr:hypothetical protein [Barrientosiimonas endolithica]
MDRRMLIFIAIAVSAVYGGAVALVEGNRQTVAIAGGIVVALAWLVVALAGERDVEND